MEQPKSTIKRRMSDIHVGGLPLWLYLLALVLLAAALWMDCLPRNIVGAFFLLMILGDGLNYLGNTIPVVKTYLGGSVICIFGGAILAAAGVFPQSAMDTMDAFVNNEGFLVLYISALITGSLFSIDRNLLLQGAVRILPVSLTALLVGFLVCGGIGEGAKSALAAANIRLYGGVCGEAVTAANALLAGLLEYDPAAHCGGHGEGGSCSGHCGRH